MTDQFVEGDIRTYRYASTEMLEREKARLMQDINDPSLSWGKRGRVFVNSNIAIGATAGPFAYLGLEHAMERSPSLSHALGNVPRKARDKFEHVQKKLRAEMEGVGDLIDPVARAEEILDFAREYTGKEIEPLKKAIDDARKITGRRARIPVAQIKLIREAADAVAEHQKGDPLLKALSDQLKNLDTEDALRRITESATNLHAHGQEGALQGYRSLLTKRYEMNESLKEAEQFIKDASRMSRKQLFWSVLAGSVGISTLAALTAGFRKAKVDKATDSYTRLSYVERLLEERAQESSPERGA